MKHDRPTPKDRRGHTASQDGWVPVKYVQAWESYSSMELHRDYLARTGRG